MLNKNLHSFIQRFGMKPQHFTAVCIVVIGAFTLAACTTSGSSRYQSRAHTSSAQQTPKPLASPGAAPNAAQQAMFADVNLPKVKVGILLPLSGQNKNLGDAMLKAAQMALFDVGHSNLELIPRDTKGTPDGAKTAAQSAIQDGAQLILGPVFASSVRAAKPVAASARINMVAFSTDWTLAGDNTYTMGFLPFDQVARITAFAASQNITSVGIIAPSNQYGRTVSNSFSNMAGRYNMRVIDSVNFPPNTANLAPFVKGLSQYDSRAANNALAQVPFQAVMMPVGGQDARAIGSLLSHYDLPPRSVRRLGTGLLDEAALASESNLNGTWFAAPSPNTRRSFETRYTSTYGKNPPRLSTLAYDATALAAVLARRGYQNGGNRPAFDRASITNVNGFSGLDGIFRFRPDNTAERGLAILEFRGGRIVVIDEAPKSFQPTQINAQAGGRSPT